MKVVRAVRTRLFTGTPRAEPHQCFTRQSSMVGSAEPPAPVQSSEPLCSCLATQPTWERTQVQHSARRSPSPPLPTCFQVCYPVCTETGNVRMVERCGAFTHIMQPGLSFLICCVDEASNHVSMRLQQIKVTCETKTKDNVFTNIEVRLVLGARRPVRPIDPHGVAVGRGAARASRKRAPPRTQAGVPFYSFRGLLYRALPPIVTRCRCPSSTR